MQLFVATLPQSFANALRRDPSLEIDVELAHEQHAAYCRALAACGAELRVIATDEAHPDGVFVEDNALVVGERALVLRSATPSRRGEERRLVEPLRAAGFEVQMAPDDVTVDGGDCLVTEREILVGRSERTNERAVAWLAELFAPLPVRAIAVPQPLLHLKTGASYLGEGRLVLDPAFQGSPDFAGYECWTIDERERGAASFRRLAGHLVLAAGYPRTAELLARSGLELHLVELGEFAKADGSVSCLSLVPYHQGEPAY